MASTNRVCTICTNLFSESYKKERSLGVMSQKFLMLFLTSKTVRMCKKNYVKCTSASRSACSRLCSLLQKTINLDMAAKILLGDPLVETKQTNSQFKSG